MSRIHEALKRAEKERSAQRTSAQLSSAVPAAAQDTSLLNVSAIPVAPTLEPVTRANFQPMHVSEEILRFDDVWNRCSRPGWRLDSHLSIFANPDAPAAVSEQFRTLRSRLYQVREKQQLRTLLISSAVPTEGKTFVSNNLALALVRQQERRVLMIDADLRCSRLHLSLGAPSSPGLSDYLKGEADEMAVVQRGIPEGLCFIAGGSVTPNPAELLANGRLKILLERLAPVFDWVIVDSPPTIPVSDSLVLADLCDGVLMVVRAGLAPSATAQKACRELSGKRIVGVVLNGADHVLGYGGYYYDQPSRQ